MFSTFRLTTGILLIAFLAQAEKTRAGDWPEFRGPTGQGISSDMGLPVTWSETEHVKWKVPVPGLGWSSPSIANGQIWLTTATEEGKSLRAVAIDQVSGKQIHGVEVFRRETALAIHEKNSHASPTPLIEGERVYVHFGPQSTACLSTDGKVLWKNEELKYAAGHGSAGSPALFRDLLIIICDGTDVQYVAALDKSTGKVRWKTSRAGAMAYSTPLVIDVPGAKHRRQAICNGGNGAVSYNPLTGKEIWRVAHEGYSLVPRPVFGGGLLYLSTGYDAAGVLGVRPDGEGDVTNSHVAWTLKRGAPNNPSPLLVGNELYLVSDAGVASCVEAATGKTIWQQRLGGNFSASPVFAGGRIYINDEEGTTHVFAAGKSFQRIAENKLDGRSLASISVAAPALYFRTDTHLYRIEDD